MQWMRYGFVFIIIFLGPWAKAQSITGHVYDEKNEPLPFATIQIIDSDQGAVSNQEGYYSLNLKPGNYKFRFQYVGYHTKDTTIQLLTSNIRILNIKLNRASFTLPTVEVNGKDEDPAYTIMRRAIGKASYHANQIDSYNARVYIKGSGRLLKVPFLFKNKINKE